MNYINWKNQAFTCTMLNMIAWSTSYHKLNTEVKRNHITCKNVPFVTHSIIWKEDNYMTTAWYLFRTTNKASPTSNKYTNTKFWNNLPNWAALRKCAGGTLFMNKNIPWPISFRYLRMRFVNLNILRGLVSKIRSLDSCWNGCALINRDMTLTETDGWRLLFRNRSLFSPQV